ncbi:low molecular weight protein-tyrosine-phosphatase [Martelella endophytica]|uniref:protein-tyrosine-phosphatase n=1 Tax=Martelella endophytica TaxID=1486262 RepID=A0A0D5LL37_MAREN|nr:low molecular weight protein-tyrosine-phosphatase [Martelella endophytica]AJY44894.1 protein tyrosine phosphatase [Martelella endophytica]
MAHPEKSSVLFVCTGNICRSPLAEGIFRHLAETAGVADDFVIASAGTGGWHEGEAPDPRSRAIAAKHGIDISAQRARKIVASDFQRFGLVLGMDGDNMAVLRRMAGTNAAATVALFSDYTLSIRKDVPDPYYGGADGFDNVYHMLFTGCQSLLSKLQASSIGS